MDKKLIQNCENNKYSTINYIKWGIVTRKIAIICGKQERSKDVKQKIPTRNRGGLGTRIYTTHDS